MQAFFTARDDDLHAKSDRDPLGQRTLWTKYASKLYKNVNSQTGDIKGYIITALGLYIVDEYKKTHNLDDEKRRDIYVLYEMIIMYILVENMIDKNKERDVHFIGKDQGRRLYQNKFNENPIINMASSDKDEKQILVNQSNLGYVGRYKSKITNDIRNELLKYAFLLDSGVQEEISENKNINKILKFFIENILEKRNEKIEYKNLFEDEEGKEVKEIILQALDIENLKRFSNGYIKTLEIKTEGVQEYIFNNIKNYIQPDESNLLKKEFSAMEIVKLAIEDNNLKEKYKDEVELLNKINVLEQFLVAINNVFFWCLENHPKKESAKSNENNNQIQEFVDELVKQYRAASKFDDVIKDIEMQYIETVSVIFSGDDEKITNAVIKDHERIYKNRRNRPWIQINEDGNIEHYHSDKNAEKNNEWIHYYYIDIVADIVRSMGL